MCRPRYHHLKAGVRFSATMPTASRRLTFLSCQRSRSGSSIVLSSYGMDDEFGCRLARRQTRLRSGSRAGSPRLFHGTRRRDTSFGSGHLVRASLCAASASHGHSRSADCVPIALANPYVERLIGSIRRECLDHMIVFGEEHLRRILGAYAAYYNQSRIHRSLNKDAPFHRAIERPGAITSHPILGGLHHQYRSI
jgi:hypothetical protein